MSPFDARLRRIVDALRERNNLAGAVRPVVLGAAAEEIAMAAYEAIAPFDLPPSYLALLREHDGIEGFYGEGGELVSTRYRGQRDAGFAGRVPVEAYLTIALDGAGRAAVLDGTEARADGERAVIELLPDGTTRRHADLLAFLDAWAEELEA